MSIVEGGNFSCDAHNFETNSPEEMENHRRGKGHYDAGQAPCLICGKVVFFTEEDKIRYPGVGRSYDVKCEECEIDANT